MADEPTSRRRRQRQPAQPGRLEQAEFAAELRRLGGRLADLRPEAAAAIRAAIHRLSSVTEASEDALTMSADLPDDEPPTITTLSQEPQWSQDQWVPQLQPSEPTSTLIASDDSTGAVHLHCCLGLGRNRTVTKPIQCVGGAAKVDPPPTIAESSSQLVPVADQSRLAVMALSVNTKFPLAVPTLATQPPRQKLSPPIRPPRTASPPLPPPPTVPPQEPPPPQSITSLPDQLPPPPKFLPAELAPPPNTLLKEQLPPLPMALISAQFPPPLMTLHQAKIPLQPTQHPISQNSPPDRQTSTSTVPALMTQPEPPPASVPVPVSTSTSSTALPPTSTVGSFRFLAMLLDQLPPSEVDESGTTSSSGSGSGSGIGGSGGSRGSGGRISAASAALIDRRSAWSLDAELEEVDACDLADEYDNLRAVVVRQR